MSTLYQKRNGQLIQVAPSSDLENEVNQLEQRVEQIEQTGSYVLPPATDTTLGGVKPDGVTVTVDGTGKISAVLPTSADPSDIEAKATATPGAPGTSDKYARADHVHPKQPLVAWGGGAGMVTIDGDYYIKAEGPRKVVFTASKAGCKVILPVLNTLKTDGLTFMIGCKGDNGITVEDAAGNTVGPDKGVIAPDKSRIFYITDVTGEGTWVCDQWGGTLVTVGGPSKWVGMTARTPVIMNVDSTAGASSLYSDAAATTDGRLFVASDMTTDKTTYKLQARYATLDETGAVQFSGNYYATTQTSIGGSAGSYSLGTQTRSNAINVFAPSYSAATYAFVRWGKRWGTLSLASGDPATEAQVGLQTFSNNTSATIYPTAANASLSLVEDPGRTLRCFGPYNYTGANSFNYAQVTGYYGYGFKSYVIQLTVSAGSVTNTTVAAGGNATVNGSAPPVVWTGTANTFMGVVQDATQAFFGGIFGAKGTVSSDKTVHPTYFTTTKPTASNIAADEKVCTLLGKAQANSASIVKLDNLNYVTFFVPADTTQVVAQAHTITYNNISASASYGYIRHKSGTAITLPIAFKTQTDSYTVRAIDATRAIIFGVSSEDTTKFVACILTVTDRTISVGPVTEVSSGLVGTVYMRGTFYRENRNFIEIEPGSVYLSTFALNTGTNTYAVRAALMHISQKDPTKISYVEVLTLTQGSKLCTMHVPVKTPTGVLVCHQDIAGGTFLPALTAVNFAA